jgi:hypothetical protein
MHGGDSFRGLLTNVLNVPKRMVASLRAVQVVGHELKQLFSIRVRVALVSLRPLASVTVASIQMPILENW